MIRYTQKWFFLIWMGILLLTGAVGVTLALLTEGTVRSVIQLITLALILILTQCMLALLLRRALKTHFYSYASMALLGGILFEGVFALSVLGYLLYGLWKPEVLSAAYLSEAFLQFPRRFSYLATGAISVISLAVCVSNAVLMRHEGVHPKNALGVLLGGGYVLVTAGMYLLTDWLHNAFYGETTPMAKPLAAGLYTFLSLTMLILLCYFECTFLGFVGMSVLAVRRGARTDKDFVIIPGCRVRPDGTPTPLLKGRVDRALRFAAEQASDGTEAPMFLPSGGKGPDEPVSEAASMAEYLKGQGVDGKDILLEDASFTTEQNMLFSKKAAEKAAPGKKKFAFSTTNYHVFRSGICAARVGMDAEGLSGATKWYFWPNGAIREYFALLKLNIPAHIKAAVIVAAVSAVIGLAAVLGWVG